MRAETQQRALGTGRRDQSDTERQAVGTEAAGLYEGHVIRVNEGQFADAMSLVGTLAHELAHQRLLGEGRLTGDEFDNELLDEATARVQVRVAPEKWEVFRPLAVEGIV